MARRRADWTLDPEDPRFPNETFELGAAAARQDRAAKGLPPELEITVPHQPTRTSTEPGRTDPVLPLEETDAA